MTVCTNCHRIRECSSYVYTKDISKPIDVLYVMDCTYVRDIDTKPLSCVGFRNIKLLLNELNHNYAIIKYLPYEISDKELPETTLSESPCLTWFNNKVQELDPKVIQVWGQELCKVIIGKNFQDCREVRNLVRYGDKTYITLASYHHSQWDESKATSPLVINRIGEDIIYSKRCACYNDSYMSKDISISVFQQLVDHWSQDSSIEYVGYDTETNTLNPLYKGSKITSFSVCVDKKIGYNIYLYHPNLMISDEDREVAIESLRKLLTTKKVVCHHAKFEYKMAKVCLGFTPNITDDSMYMVRTVLTEYPFITYGLKSLAGRFTDMGPWEEDVHRFSNLLQKLNRSKNINYIELAMEYSTLSLQASEIEEFNEILKSPNYYIKSEYPEDPFYWLIPTKILAKYAGLDAIAPLLLMDKFKPIIDKDKGFQNIYNMLMDAAEAYANIELRGVAIKNHDYWKNRYKEEIAACKSNILDLEAVKLFIQNNGDLNFNSSQQIGNLLQTLGAKVPRTSKGALSVTTDVISDLLEKCPESNAQLKTFLQNYHRMKKLSKLDSTYISGIDDKILMRSFDGNKLEWLPEVPSVHYDYNLHSVATGRVSSGMHTWPSQSDIKEMTSSHWHGNGGLIVAADYSACELRNLASLCDSKFGDPTMANAFRGGHDLHTYTASMVFKKPEEDIDKTERRMAKTASFSVVYGSSVQSFAENFNMSLQEAQEVFNKYFDVFPGIKKYIDYQHQFVSKHGYVRGPNGRIRYLLDGLDPSNRRNYSAALRQAGNTPIQGPSSDCMIQACNALSKLFKSKGMSSGVLASIHDACYIDAAPGEVIADISILRYCMKDYVEQVNPYLVCPLGVDVELTTGMNDGFYVSNVEYLDNGVIRLSGKGFDDNCNPVFNELSCNYDVYVKTLSKEFKDDTVFDGFMGAISLSKWVKHNDCNYEIYLLPYTGKGVTQVG